MASVVTNSEADILSRVIDPDEPCLSREAAECILQLGFPREDVERMNTLAERARAGILTPEERELADRYERVGHFLSLLKSKARLSLKHATHAS